MVILVASVGLVTAAAILLAVVKIIHKVRAKKLMGDACASSGKKKKRKKGRKKALRIKVGFMGKLGLLGGFGVMGFRMLTGMATDGNGVAAGELSLMSFASTIVPTACTDGGTPPHHFNGMSSFMDIAHPKDVVRVGMVHVRVSSLNEWDSPSVSLLHCMAHWAGLFMPGLVMVHCPDLILELAINA